MSQTLEEITEDAKEAFRQVSAKLRDAKKRQYELNQHVEELSSELDLVKAKLRAINTLSYPAEVYSDLSGNLT